MTSTISRWTQPIYDKNAKERRDDRALGLIVCNIILCVIVIVCFECEVQGHIGGDTKTFFLIGEVIIGIAYGLNAYLSRTIPAKLFRLLGSSVDIPSIPAGFSVPIEFIGVFNTFTVGYLTYYTGGPSNSPYAQVLVAMLLIAEQTRRVRNPHHEGRVKPILAAPFTEFRTFLSLTALFYLLLGYLQWKHPVQILTAPAGVTIGITLVIFLVGTLTNYVSGSSRVSSK